MAIGGIGPTRYRAGVTERRAAEWSGHGDPSPKAALRRELLAKRAAIDMHEREAYARQLVDRLGAFAPWTSAVAIGSYRPMGAEVSPPEDEGRSSFPVIDPPGFAPRPIGELGVLLMPVVAVALDGTRLGRGGGWYDRLLGPLAARPLLIAVAYELQVVDRLPRDRWDVPVDIICTPARIIFVSPR